MDFDDKNELTDDDYVNVANDDLVIHDFVAEWMEQTKIGSCLMTKSMWKESIDTFKQIFEKDWDGSFKVTERKLYNYLNNIVLSIVNAVAAELVRTGEAELYWDDKEMDFCFMSKEKSHG